MGGVARAVISPLSIIDRDLGRTALQIISVAALFVPGGQPVAALAALALATLFKPRGPKPEQQERSIKTALPPRVSAYGRVKLYGAYILFETNADGQAVDVWAFHDGRIDAIERYYLGDKQVTLIGNIVQKGADGIYGNNEIQVGASLGLDVEAAFAPVMAALPGIWTGAHRGDGVCTGYMISNPVKSKNYSDVYPQGGPDATPLGLVIRAQLLFDWRDPTQVIDDPSSWKWSENAALATAHYYLVRMGKDWETQFLPTLATWTAFADDCDVAMDLKDGGTEPRYRVALAHKHTDAHKAVTGNLLAACDGWVAPRSDGALVAYSGRYYVPTVSIGPDQIVNWSWDEGVVDEDAINEIAVSYLSADHDFTVVDATAWRDEDAISTAGEVKSTTLENAVPSHAQARRLAKRLMAKSMAEFRGSITTNRAGRIIRGERFVDLHIEEAGEIFYSGPAEITQLTRNLETGGVTFTWIAADPDIDAWDPATEEGEPAPVADGVASTGLLKPTINSTTPQYGEDVGSGANGARILLEVTAPIRPDLIWFVWTRESGGTVWTERSYTDVDPGPFTYELLTEFVAIDASIEIEVAYQVGDGRNSPRSDPATVGTSSSGLAPNPTTDVSAVGGVGEITPTWRNPASLNYSYTRSYYGVSSSFGSATALSPDDASSPSAIRSSTFTGISPGTYNVWTRAFSASGVGSTPTKAPGTVTVT